MGKRFFAILMIALTITYSVFAIVIIKQKESIKEKDIEISELQFEKTKLQSKYNSVYDEKSDIEYEIDKIESEYSFFNSYAVICDDNSNYFHHYNCDEWDKDSFFIFNVDNAVDSGYNPCPECH